MKTRIAILSMTNISCSNATGSLLSRLFKNWEKDSIIQVCKYRHSDEVADEFQNIVPFYDFMERWRASKNWLFRLPAAVLRRLFFPLLFFIGNKKQVLEELQKFLPEVLYLRVVGQPFYYLKLAIFLKKRLNIPLVLHFMDDYDLHLKIEGKTNPIKWIQSRLYTNFLNKTIELSDLNFAISENMATAFKKRYGVPFKVAHNGIEIADYKHFKTTKYDKIVPKRILWAGAIELSKDNQIVKKIAQAIENINQEIPCQFFLNVPNSFVEPAKKLAAQYSSVAYQTYQPLAEYKRLLASSELLIIARNFDETTRAYTQFSFHNKLPDFLSSGTPILAIGAEWDNTVQLLKKYGFGEVVLRDDIVDIEEKIRAVLEKRKIKSNPEGAFSTLGMNKIRENFQISISQTIKISKK